MIRVLVSFGVALLASRGEIIDGVCPKAVVELQNVPQRVSNTSPECCGGDDGPSDGGRLKAIGYDSIKAKRGAPR